MRGGLVSEWTIPGPLQPRGSGLVFLARGRCNQGGAVVRYVPLFNDDWNG